MNERLSPNLSDLMQDLQKEAKTAKTEQPPTPMVAEKPLTATEKALAENVAAEQASQQKMLREKQQTENSLKKTLESLAGEKEAINASLNSGKVSDAVAAMRRLYKQVDRALDTTPEEQRSALLLMNSSAQEALRKGIDTWFSTMQAAADEYDVWYFEKTGKRADVHRIVEFTPDDFINLHQLSENLDAAITREPTPDQPPEPPIAITFNADNLTAALKSKGLRDDQIKPLSLYQKLDKQFFDFKEEKMKTYREQIMANLQQHEIPAAIGNLEKMIETHKKGPESRVFKYIQHAAETIKEQAPAGALTKDQQKLLERTIKGLI